MAKVDRKKLLKKPDEFLTLSDKAIQWARANMRTLIIVVSALVLAVVCALGIQAYLRYRTAQGANALAQVFPMYQRAVLGQASKQEMAGAMQGLAQVVEKYGATPSGMQARLALAGLQYSTGQYAEAELNFAELAEDPGTPAQLLPLALRGLGQSLAAQKKYPQAAQAIRRAIEAAGPQTAILLKLDLGLVLEAAGDKKAAIATYRELLKASPDGAAAKEATNRLVAMGIDPHREPR